MAAPTFGCRPHTYHEACHLAAGTCYGSMYREPPTGVYMGELWAFAMLHVHVGCVDVGLRAVRARRMICFPLHTSCPHHS